MQSPAQADHALGYRHSTPCDAMHHALFWYSSVIYCPRRRRMVFQIHPAPGSEAGANTGHAGQHYIFSSINPDKSLFSSFSNSSGRPFSQAPAIRADKRPMRPPYQGRPAQTQRQAANNIGSPVRRSIGRSGAPAQNVSPPFSVFATNISTLPARTQPRQLHALRLNLFQPTKYAATSYPAAPGIPPQRDFRRGAERGNGDR